MKTEPTEAYEAVKYYEANNINIDAFRAKKLCDVAFYEGQSSPNIKQLEWMEYENLRGRKSYFAKTQFSPYEVADGGDHFTMFSPNKRLRFASVGEAKAAAQADFERRVMGCLDL